MTITQTEIMLNATDGTGSFMAYVAKPNNVTDAPVIIVIQEIFGVNGYIRGLCDELATKGYIAMSPDLFWRQEPGINITDKTKEEWDKAFELFGGFNIDKGIDDIKTSLTAARTIEGCNGKVATMGYCLGGKLAYLMACRSNADCNISYYGVAIDQYLSEKEEIKTPLLMHVAADDKFVSRETQEIMEAQLVPHDHVDYYRYDGVDHAFARVGGEHFDKEAANTANERSFAFLNEHL